MGGLPSKMDELSESNNQSKHTREQGTLFNARLINAEREASEEKKN